MNWRVIKVPSNGATPRVLYEGPEIAARNEFNTEFLKGKRNRLQLVRPDGTTEYDTAELRKGVRVG